MDGPGSDSDSSVDSDSDPGNQSDSDQSWLDQLQRASDLEISKDDDHDVLGRSHCTNLNVLFVDAQAGPTYSTKRASFKRKEGSGVKCGSLRGHYNKRAKFAERKTYKPGPRAKPTSTRAQKVATKFKDNLSFLTCACCPFAGPQHLFLSIDDFRKTNQRALIYNGVRKSNRVQQLLSKSSEQANAYAFEFDRSFTGFGLLKGLQYLCKRCRDGLIGSCPQNDQPVDVASMFGDVVSTNTIGNGTDSGDESDDADDERDNGVHGDSVADECGETDPDNDAEFKAASTKKRGKGDASYLYLEPPWATIALR
jgi:hypothetical protein